MQHGHYAAAHARRVAGRASCMPQSVTCCGGAPVGAVLSSFIRMAASPVHLQLGAAAPFVPIKGVQRLKAATLLTVPQGHAIDNNLQSLVLCDVGRQHGAQQVNRAAQSRAGGQH